MTCDGYGLVVCSPSQTSLTLLCGPQKGPPPPEPGRDRNRELNEVHVRICASLHCAIRAHNIIELKIVNDSRHHFLS